MPLETDEYMNKALLCEVASPETCMMNALDNLSLRGKLFLLSGLSCGVLLFAIAFALYEVRLIEREVGAIGRHDLPGLQAAGAMGEWRLRYRVRSLEFMMASGGAETERMTASLDQLHQGFMKEIAGYRTRQISERERALLDAVERSVLGYHEVVQQARDLLARGDRNGADTLRRTVWVQRADAARDTVAELIAYNRAAAEGNVGDVAAEVRAAFIGGLSAAAIGLAVAITLTLVFAGRMSGRLRAAVSGTQQIATGDLRAALPEPSADEIGDLVRAMRDMQSSLRETIALSRDGAGQVGDSATSLLEASRQVSEGASAQSQAASSIAANVEELTVSISHVSDRTSDASRVAAESGAGATAGKQSMERLVAGMREVEQVVGDAATRITGLEAQSAKISHIVAVIREIAEQTNLLALNAAIEAARAGEQGRGFAVVADEVRKLAERTATSTEEITGMVASVQAGTKEAVAGIERGVQVVRRSSAEAVETGGTIGRLHELSGEVAGIVSELDLALREQATASSEVARRVEDIALRAEQSSSATRSIVVAAQEMEGVAAQMRRQVERFKV